MNANTRRGNGVRPPRRNRSRAGPPARPAREPDGKVAARRRHPRASAVAFRRRRQIALLVLTCRPNSERLGETDSEVDDVERGFQAFDFLQTVSLIEAYRARIGHRHAEMR